VSLVDKLIIEKKKHIKGKVKYKKDQWAEITKRIGLYDDSRV